MPRPLLLHSHRAIITGASRGIGLSIARLFASEGASCLLVARSDNALKQAVEDLEVLKSQRGNESGIEFKQEQKFGYVAGGVEEEETWKVVGEKETSPTVLINAAGITHRSLLLSTPTSVTQDVLNTNLLGTILACKSISKSMVRQRKGGCIINISSVYGLKGGKGSTIYAATKAGVIGFSRALSVELAGSRIRVNSISPGYIDTDMLASSTPEEKKSLAAQALVNRLGTSDEIAQAALYITLNGFVNGTNLVVDGGLSAV